jgi:hypothetical protein
MIKYISWERKTPFFNNQVSFKEGVLKKVKPGIEIKKGLDKLGGSGILIYKNFGKTKLLQNY